MTLLDIFDFVLEDLDLLSGFPSSSLQYLNSPLFWTLVHLTKWPVMWQSKKCEGMEKNTKSSLKEMFTVARVQFYIF